MIANGIVITPLNNEGLIIANGVPQTRHNGLVIVNGVPRVVASEATLMDSWAKAEYSSGYNIRVGADRGGGQSVTGDGGVLDYINFIIIMSIDQIKTLITIVYVVGKKGFPNAWISKQINSCFIFKKCLL